MTQISNLAPGLPASTPPGGNHQAAPAHTRLPIPAAAKGFQTPPDINAFITLIYDNMYAYVDGKMVRNLDNESRPNMVQDVIDNFVMYILAPAPTRNNALRYTLYDPINHPNVAYYKWFLTQLDFFRRDRQRELVRERKMFTLSEGDYEDTQGTPGNKAVSLDSVSFAEPTVDPDDDFDMRRLEDRLLAFSTRHAAMGPRKFEPNAFRLYSLKMADEQTKDIAAELGISSSAVGQWMGKLRELVIDLTTPSRRHAA